MHPGIGSLILLSGRLDEGHLSEGSERKDRAVGLCGAVGVSGAAAARVPARTGERAAGGAGEAADGGRAVIANEAVGRWVVDDGAVAVRAAVGFGLLEA